MNVKCFLIQSKHNGVVMEHRDWFDLMTCFESKKGAIIYANSVFYKGWQKDMKIVTAVVKIKK